MTRLLAPLVTALTLLALSACLSPRQPAAQEPQPPPVADPAPPANAPTPPPGAPAPGRVVRAGGVEGAAVVAVGRRAGGSLVIRADDPGVPRVRSGRGTGVRVRTDFGLRSPGARAGRGVPGVAELGERTERRARKLSRVPKLRVGKPQVGEAHVGKSRVGKPQVGEVRVGQSRVGKVQVGEVRVGESRVGGKARVGKLLVGEARGGKPRVGEARVARPRVVNPWVLPPRLLRPPVEPPGEGGVPGERRPRPEVKVPDVRVYEDAVCVDTPRAHVHIGRCRVARPEPDRPRSTPRPEPTRQSIQTPTPTPTPTPTKAEPAPSPKMRILAERPVPPERRSPLGTVLLMVVLTTVIASGTAVAFGGIR